MKRLIRILAWILGLVGGLFILAILFLGIIGVPKPNTITNKDVPRISWTHAFDTYRLIQEKGASTQFAAWNSSDTGMYVWAKGKGLRPILQTLSHPDETPQPIEGIPPLARNIQTNPHQPFLIYALD